MINTAKKNFTSRYSMESTTNRASLSDYTAIYVYPSVSYLDNARVGAFENYVYLTSSKKLWLLCIVDTMEEICGENVGGSPPSVSFPVSSVCKPWSGVTKTKMGRYASKDLKADYNDDNGFQSTICTMGNYRSLPPFPDPTLNPKFPEIEDTSLLLILHL